jgi:hypothetical protein
MNVLSLCDKTTVACLPWARAGATCVCLDIQHESVFPTPELVGEGRIFKVKADVTRLPKAVADIIAATKWDIVFAFPPCTHLAVSGARWFAAKGPEKLAEAMAIVNACRDICERSGAPWMLENPISRLATLWKKPSWYFSPWEYAGYLADPSEDAYTKLTAIWCSEDFVMPPKKPVALPEDPKLRHKIHRMAPSPDRADKRSVTPRGFAEATFIANCPVVEPRMWTGILRSDTAA